MERDKRGREVVSKEEFDRRVQEAAWNELDKQPHPAHHFLWGGLFLRRRSYQPGNLMKIDELEERLRRMEDKREESLYRPKQSRWWHRLWPF